jgi:hypothetical protein
MFHQLDIQLAATASRAPIAAANLQICKMLLLLQHAAA